MAITWNFHLISSTRIESNTILNIIKKYQTQIKVKTLFSIDDWTWNNQQKLQSILEINEKLDGGEIIIANLEWNGWKSAGMYIEKEEDYLYTLWVNTEGIPALDAEIVDYENTRYYERAYQFIGGFIKEHSIGFKAIAIGVESDILHNGDMQKMIESSEHVVAWMVNESLEVNFSTERYQEKIIGEWDMVIWEMKQMEVDRRTTL